MTRAALIDDTRDGMSTGLVTYSYRRQPGPDFAEEIARSYRFEWISLPGSNVLALTVLRHDGAEIARLVPEAGANVEKLAWYWAECDAMKNSPPPLPPICGPLEVVP